jgi:hypothetical protein
MPQAATFVNYIYIYLKITPYFRQSGTQIILKFIRAARKLTLNKDCGSLPNKVGSAWRSWCTV